MLQNGKHISYCTNIHAGESFDEVFESLKINLLPIKIAVCNSEPFGIGLRLSNRTVNELFENDNLLRFKTWLEQYNIYVFTGNAFPFGDFHHTKVKENVHTPDWLSDERVKYTCNFAKIMAQLPNIGNEQGISTSPLSYKYWHISDEEKVKAFEISAKNLIKTARYLSEQEQITGKYIHLDIEPEPDGLLENSTEFITFYTTYLLQEAKNQGCETELVKRYITICYDVCHFAVMFENHENAIFNLQKHGIKIGKFQISSALKVVFNDYSKHQTLKHLSKFVESTYLHQVVEHTKNGNFIHHKDLNLAIKAFTNESVEWRIHFHVPIYAEIFSEIASTRNDIETIIKLNHKLNLSTQLEIETYTWDILPGVEKLPLVESIIKEIDWLKNQMQ